jgi:putative NADPH-quinone reductase
MINDSSILVYFAHLDIERSLINRTLCKAVNTLSHVNFRDLHELYPDFFIDIRTEQALLRSADLIVFQHPIYWYAAPAIFKHFQDTVLTEGFAFGRGGDVLHGKDFLLVASTGAAVEEYQPGGIHHYRFEELIRPIEQSTRFCGMRFLPPLVLHGGHGLSQDVIDAHATNYRRILEEYKPASSGREA